MVQIWLKHIDDWSAMNDIWDSWVVPSAPPARATGQSAMASPDILVEMIVTAAVGKP